MTTLIFVSAVSMLILVLQDAFEVMLLPRRVHRRVRLMRFFFKVTWAIWSRMAGHRAAGASRERFLSIYGPLSMLVLFALWAAGLIVAFGLIEWALQTPAGERSPVGEQIYMSGVTFFTLGYGDVVPRGGAARFVAVTEAGTGIGFIAVVIGYLPVLYQLFSRREAHVLQLDGRAGTPPTAVTLLKRHVEANRLDKLDILLREWEIWGAELLESHLSYPMLVFYRSQHHDQSWLAALTAIMDTCAMILVGIEDVSHLQARMTFTLARQVVVEMSHSLRIAPARQRAQNRLPHETFTRMEALFNEIGLKWKGADSTEEILAALRATYEPFLEGLAARLLLALPHFLPEADAIDHWEQGPRGLVASRLMKELAERQNGFPGRGAGQVKRWRWLRSRLKRDESQYRN